MMSSATAEYTPTTMFTLFLNLPTELRLKIWASYLALSPPQLIPFHLCKSDLDYLRLRRKACHNYPHIFCSRLPIPPILHVCRESREIGFEQYSLGFDIDRMSSLGKAETDVETYTTCSHEVALVEKGRGVYWDKNRDVVFLDTADWAEEDKAAYAWGGKTGIRFGKMVRVAMGFETLMSCGFGEHLSWEGIEEILVVRPEGMSREEMRDEGRWAWGSRSAGREGYVKMYLTSKRMTAGDGGEVRVKFDFGNMEELREYVICRPK